MESVLAHRAPRPESLGNLVAEVYAQARFRCSNPQCGKWIALNDQHLVFVDDHGEELAENLLAFCPQCLSRRFPQAMRAAWKSVQLAYESPYDYDSFTFLAFLEAVGEPLEVETSRLIDLRHLVTAGAVQANRASGRDWSIELTVGGQLLLEAWRQGKPG